MPEFTDSMNYCAWRVVARRVGQLYYNAGYGLDTEEPAEARAALSRSSSVSAFWISSTSRDSKNGSPHWLQTHAGIESQETW
jgi:hypothetical protein